ncbi:MAG: hypothetical protein HC803_07490 [Saprospiraceae bacterium]|nr:hypothetical protein [Saprospiraceae bacterium]
MTQLSMYQLFELREVNKIEELDSWLKDLPDLSQEEKVVANLYQGLLLENINAWNEHELSLNFIGPIFGAIKFPVKHKLNWFAQRPLSSIVGDYELKGKPDGTLASGYLAPEITYFSFQEFKKDIDSSGDPIGQSR